MTARDREARERDQRVLQSVGGGVYKFVTTREHAAHMRAIRRQRRALRRLPKDQRQGRLFPSAFTSRRPTTC